jgi:hypothetical protein
MAKLFGFSIEKEDLKQGAKSPSSPVPPTDNDATSAITPYGGWFGHYVDLDGIKHRDELNLIRKYREMSLSPEVDSAIEDITNEAIVSDKDDSPVELELSNLEVSESIKTSMRVEFEHIKRLLDFDKTAHQIFRRWYVDGRIYYHKVIDLKDSSKGILELRYIDPLKIKKYRYVQKPPQNSEEFNQYDYGAVVEFYVYNNKGINSTNQGIKIAKDAIASVTSGITDQGRNITLSHLHKAIKSLNQLKMLEDSIVIYRLSRAPERRIFYIDVGNLPKVKAEQYLRDVMSRYRNKLVYDSATGEMRDDKKHMSIMEDYWLPRREGGRGTEITTLPGGQNLGELTDIKYFQTQVYKALNVPSSRLESDKSFDLGKSEEINRDEIKFTKFVGRLRKKFSDLLHDLLRTQLILKGVITSSDWEEFKEHIQYDFLYDNQFAEMADLEMLEKKMEVLDKVDLYVGKYFSQDYVMRQLLQFTEQEITEMKIQINNEIKSGQVIDPLDVVDQEKQSSELDLETKKVSINNMKNPTAPTPVGNKNTK